LFLHGGKSRTDGTISDVRVISIVWLGEKRVGRFAGLKVKRLKGWRAAPEFAGCRFAGLKVEWLKGGTQRRFSELRRGYPPGVV